MLAEVAGRLERSEIGPTLVGRRDFPARMPAAKMKDCAGRHRARREHEPCLKR